MNLALAFLLRDIAIEKTYRFNLLSKSLGIIFQLAVFFFLSKLVSNADYFSFVLIGLMFSRFFHFWLTTFAESIRQEQYWGTLEMLFLSPNPAFKIIFSSLSGKLLILLAEMAVYILAGKFLFNAVFFFGFFRLIPILILNSLSLAGLGLVSAAFIMYFKRGDPVNWALSSSFDLLSGVYFPVSVLPFYLRGASKFLPNTSALDAWRKVLLGNTFPSPESLAIQSLWGFGLIFLGIFCFRKAYTLSKKNGELGSY
jgi:ABC-2 type transport system permease protein